MEGSAPSGVEDLEPTSPGSEKPQKEAEEKEQVVESSSGDDSPSMEMVQTFFSVPCKLGVGRLKLTRASRGPE